MICIFLIGLSLMFVGKGHTYDVMQAMRVADSYLKRGLDLEAIGVYQDIVDNSNDYDIQAKSVLRIGDIYSYFLNNDHLALEKYSIVKEKYHRSEYVGNAYFNSGMILYEKGKNREALEQFRKYLERFPRGERRGTAEFMIETCSKPSTMIKKEDKRETFKISIDEKIRVLIIEGKKEITVSCSTPFMVKDLNGMNTLFRLPSDQIAVVRTHSKTIMVNDAALPSSTSRLVIFPSEEGILKVNGKSYRGRIRIQKSTDGGVDVINVLGLEEYLYGVVPKEMSPRWSSEALMAQAIVARSYAVYQKEKNKNKDYDVYSTTYSQVYGGYDVESEHSNRAVYETRGKMLVYDNQPVLAYFHSNSGGQTENAKNVWTADVPYLKGIPDSYSAKAPNYLWTLFLGLDEIKGALNKHGVGIGDIHEITTPEVSPSGRVKRVRILHSGGESILTGNNFRIKVDPTMIKSTLFTMTRERNGIRFDGRGYGHGVGLSQWGAYVMAKEGHSCRDILKHYYSEVDIR
ncbi:MAG: SpoIID/LytB domain-containing protein [Syntrophales bacterium]|nr:SpoIID/LytB domain-containing protein [Syntrophales bacterium]